MRTPTPEDVERANDITRRFHSGEISGADYADSLVALVEDVQGRQFSHSELVMMANQFETAAAQLRARTSKPSLTLIIGGRTNTATYADASEALRLLRRIFRKMAQIFALAEPLPPPEEQHDWYRSSGDVECDVCGELYRSHAEDPREPWMTIVCNGRRVKL